MAKKPQEESTVVSLDDPAVQQEIGVDPADDLQTRIEKRIMRALGSYIDPKELNPLLANAIRFLALKHRISGEDDGGSFFDN
jgi:hypothetical protein